MGTIAGRAARIVVAAALGAGLGFFVAIAMFADGNWQERIPILGVLLLAYAMGGAALGYRAAWWYGALLAVPGLAALALLAASGEGRWWHAALAALLIALSAGGGYGGSRGARGQRSAMSTPA